MKEPSPCYKCNKIIDVERYLSEYKRFQLCNECKIEQIKNAPYDFCECGFKDTIRKEHLQWEFSKKIIGDSYLLYAEKTDDDSYILTYDNWLLFINHASKLMLDYSKSIED